MTDNDDLALHDLFYGILLEKVRQDRYPSVPMLNLLEQNMAGHERQELLEVLLERIAADRFPSMTMLQRAARIAR